jgi:hypothetical protein
LTLQERADSYAAFCAKHNFPAAIGVAGGWLYGSWILGNNYQSAQQYYGEYPPGYLPRIAALFPDKRRILHLFSGMVNLIQLPGDTCDINPALNPTYVDNAQTMEKVPLERYDLIVGDPPYSAEDAEKYGCTMVKRNKVFDTLGRRLSSGTHIVWLDTALTMYRKADLQMEGLIGISRSTNHRFRAATIFRRV